MKIRRDIRDTTDDAGTPVEIEKAMQEKSEEFKKQGAEIYT